MPEGLHQRVVDLFLEKKGFHWAEAILQALKEELSVECAVIPRIATPFGAGLGRSGMLCGVVSGSLMAIGLLRGRDRGGDATGPAFDAARRFISRFRDRFGDVECRPLTGYDLASSAQRKLMALNKVKENSCRRYLEWAIDELTPYLP